MTIVLAGCGTQGSPVAEKTPAPTKETAFDPCSIPDDAIAAAGLDPSTVVADIGPAFSVSEANVCSWEAGGSSPWYSVAVFFSWSSSTHAMSQRTVFRDVEDVQVLDRRGAKFRFDSTDPSTGCINAFDVAGGLLAFDLETKGSRQTQADTCETLAAIVSKLDPELPKSA